MPSQANPQIHSIFDPNTWTFTYIVHNGPGSHCAIIDSVLDYDPKSGRTRHTSADKVIAYITEHQLHVTWILETHAHADHMSGAAHLKQKLGGKIAIGNHITQVQHTFKSIFNLEAEFRTDGSQFDHLLNDGEMINLGELSGKILFVPGHTPACVAYQFGDAIFVGDTLFMPDVGTARCDFPGGNARTLYRSIQKILAYPADTRLFMCHDYPPNGREIRFVSNVAEQRAHNIHVHNGMSEEDYVALRTQRDSNLDMPVLVLPAIQINIRAGEMPPKEDNGVAYLKIPLNAL